MNLFIAGLFTASFMPGKNAFDSNLNDTEKMAVGSVDNYLESYHYIHKDTYLSHIRQNDKKVFLDSGAFSAFSLGVSVDLPTYCRWIQENNDIIRYEDGVCMASVLDGIGDPLKTWQNQVEMERLGATPLPCFHWGEDERYLEWYISRYPYITLGGLVPISKPQQREWLDRIWDKYLTDGSGRARLKVHGFGLTTPELMARYPWHSVDSSSWVQIGAHGNVILDGKTYAVSSQSPNAKVAMQHIDTLTEPMTAALESKIRERGFDPERIRHNTYSRWALNAAEYSWMGRKIDTPAFKKEQPELWG